MHPDARIIPSGYTPGARPPRERIEASISDAFRGEAAVPPHCLEDLQRIGAQLVVSCEFRFVDIASREGSTEYLVRQALVCQRIRLERLGRNSGFVLSNSPDSEHRGGGRK
jgi:hypothetical protein